MGDEEVAAAGLVECWRDLGHAEPVGIGLDHGGGLFGRIALAQLLVVLHQRAEIDGQYAASRTALNVALHVHCHLGNCPRLLQRIPQ
ncbi:hypothetical protein D9M70_636540 [compost metagenome]